MKRHKKRLQICVIDCKNEKELYEWAEIAMVQHQLQHIQKEARTLELYAGEELLRKSFYNRVDVLLKLQQFHEWLADLTDEYRIAPLNE